MAKVYEISQNYLRVDEGVSQRRDLGTIKPDTEKCGFDTSNIAEGAARKSKAEFLQFLSIAQGSLSELDTQLEVAYMLGYIDEEKRKGTLDEITGVFKMLSGLIRSVK